MARNKLLVANWKLNHCRREALSFAEEIKGRIKKNPLLDTAIAPVATLLHELGHALSGSCVSLAAQNVSFSQQGAFTGEISAQHLKEQGANYCIVGHSERRAMFFETDEDVGKKVAALHEASITPIICVGESLLERNNNQWKAVLERQCAGALAQVKSSVVIAYEPIWAIGTGKAADHHDAEEAHSFIRQEIAKHLGMEKSLTTRIIYGGSVSLENVGSYANQPNIDGALVGKASLQVSSFLSMVEVLGGIKHP